MKFVIDDRIPFIRGVFEPHGEVIYLPGGAIGKDHLVNADCLLVRTRTRCNADLLTGSSVRFIGTATIGFDHIDTGWCKANGINWSNAPGCNSGSVAQYITSALLEMADRQGFNLNDKTLGIIGAGNVGKKVERIGRLLGMDVLVNDPPRERAEGSENFTSLPVLLRESDIVSIHVPLNRQGLDNTFHLVGREFLGSMKPGAALFNSSRGEVVDESELIRVLKASTLIGPGFTVLDVWENEPDINLELLDLIDIGTPHIAGYSLDGKHNATRMIVETAFRHFGLPINEEGTGVEPLNSDLLLDAGQLAVGSRQGACPGPDPGAVGSRQFVRASYDIMTDDRRLRESPGSFENQRNSYPVRREFSAFRVEPFPQGETGRILGGLGFRKGD